MPEISTIEVEEGGRVEKLDTRFDLPSCCLLFNIKMFGNRQELKNAFYLQTGIYLGFELTIGTELAPIIGT